MNRYLTALLLSLLYLIVALNGVGLKHIIEDDEAREIGIIQDVMAGQWLWPRFNNTLIPDKPTLFHWMSAIPGSMPGDFEFNVRAFSVFAAACAIFVVVLLATEVFSSKIGLVAGLILFTTATFFNHARVARPDTLLILLLTLAYWFAFRWWRSEHSKYWWWAMVFLGMSVLAKGPVGPALFAVTIFTFALWERRTSDLFRLALHPAMVVFLALASSWYLLAWAGWGSSFIEQHLLGRYVRNVVGGEVGLSSWDKRGIFGSLIFYPKHLPLMIMPWAPFLFFAFYRIWRNKEFTDSRYRFLICWALAPVIVFTPAEWKLRYYLLPSVPALALLVAPTVSELLSSRSLRGKIQVRNTSIVALVSVLVAAATAFILKNPGFFSKSDRNNIEAMLSPGEFMVPVLVVGALLVSLFVGVLILQRRWSMMTKGVFIAAILWLGFGVEFLERSVSDESSLTDFAAVVENEFPKNEPVYFLESPVVNSIIVYSKREISSLDGAVEKADAGSGVILTEAKYEKLHQQGVLGEVLATGFGRIGNTKNGTLVLTTAVGQ